MFGNDLGDDNGRAGIMPNCRAAVVHPGPPSREADRCPDMVAVRLCVYCADVCPYRVPQALRHLAVGDRNLPDARQLRRKPSELERIKEEGVLRVITRNSPSTYFRIAMAKPASSTSWSSVSPAPWASNCRSKPPTTSTTSSAVSIVPAARHWPLRDWSPAKAAELARFTRSYLDVTTRVVYHSGQRRPTSPKDLIGKRILVLKGSSRGEAGLAAGGIPELRYDESDAVEVVDLLRMVDEGQIDLTLVESNEMSMNRCISATSAPASTSENRTAAWVVAKGEDDSCSRRPMPSSSRPSRTVHCSACASVTTAMSTCSATSVPMLFAKHLQQRLPRYEKAFRETAKEHGIDWRLLAAIGYRESHWQPEATFQDRRARADDADPAHRQCHGRDQSPRSGTEHSGWRQGPCRCMPACRRVSRSRTALVRPGRLQRRRRPSGRCTQAGRG